MKIITWISALELLCKLSNQWGMYIHTFPPEEGPDESTLAAPYINTDTQENIELWSAGTGFLLFDTEEEMLGYYNQTVGDDGPTETNDYEGETRVYALTCNNLGELQTENT